MITMAARESTLIWHRRPVSLVSAKSGNQHALDTANHYNCTPDAKGGDGGGLQRQVNLEQAPHGKGRTQPTSTVPACRPRSS